MKLALLGLKNRHCLALLILISLLDYPVGL